jgi:hypothetical protein
MPAIELGIDTPHELDSVDHKTGNQAVYLGVLHDHADQRGTAEVALAELRAGRASSSKRGIRTDWRKAAG